MANEFIIRKGFKSLQDSQITGSLNLSGDLEVLGSISGDITGSASTASYIELSNVDGSASLASRIFTNSSSIASLEIVSGSYANSASFASSISSNSSSLGSLNAVSSSYLLNTTDTLTGDLTVTGNIIATTLNVQDVTASVVYSSGSNVFGSSSIDTQQFTGSIKVSGSVDLQAGDATFAGKVIASNGIEVTGGSTGADIYINNTSPTLGFTDTNSFTDPSDIYIIRSTSGDKLQFQWYDDSAGTTTETFNIGNTGNATFEGDVGMGKLTATKSGTAAVFNSGTTNVVASFTSTDGTGVIQCADDGGNVEFGAAGNNFVVQPAGGVAQLTVGASNSIFTGDIGIGTGGYAQKPLDISGATGGQVLITGADDAVGTTAGILLRAEGGEANGLARVKGGIFFERIAGTYGNGDLKFAINSSANNDIVTVADVKMAITSNGTLTVGGATNTRLVTTITENSIIDLNVIDGTSTARALSFSTGGTARVVIDANGSVYNNSGTGQTFFGSNNAGNPSSVTGVSNSSFGYGAGNALTSGYQNVSVGRDAGGVLTTGLNNVSVGTNAGYNNVDGQQNTYVGTASGYVSPGQNYNTFVGYESGHNNTANENTAVGRLSLHANTSGVRNTAIGTESLKSNQTGDANTALGYQSLFTTTGDRNIAIGDRAGYNITAGSMNIAIGFLALSGGTGNSCIAIGDNALSSDGTFEESVAIGDSALQTQQSGRNHAFGFHALQDLTTGNYNTAVGGEAGENITTGTVNTAVGTFALRTATDAGGQTAVGYQALYTSNGNGNVGMGQQAGYSISTGTFNIVIGHECGFGLTGGNNNVLIGDRAGRVLANGIDNVFIGTQAAYNRTGGNENTFVGEKANGIGIGTGNNNTGLGRFVGYKLTSGTKNTFIGHQSGLEATTADNSTFVGKNAGSLVTTGDNNTFIGEEAGSNVTIGDNNVCLGKDSATPSNSSTNTIVLGNSLIQSLQCQVQNISGLSDERDKTNIKNSEYGLDLINSLRPVTFEWNQRDGKKIGKKDLGFIAQDLQKIDDKHLSLVNDENPEKLLASYGRLIPVLVKSIQELKAEIEILKNK